MHLHWFVSVFILFNALESIQCGTTNYTLETLVNMIQKLEESQKQLKALINEQNSKNQQNVNPTTEAILNQKESTVVSEFVGKNVSLLEVDKEREDQKGGCGGILVADKGEISFEHVAPKFLKKNSKFTCVWTIRAGLFQKVFFKLTRSEFSNDKDILLFVTPLKAYNHRRPASVDSSTSETLSKETKNVVVDGPVVFLTLVVNKYSSLSFPKFGIYYEGREFPTDSSIEYRHYHFNEPQGQLDYPAIRGADTYSPNEVTTFVFNPNPPLVSIELNSLDLETKSDNCYYDALTFLSQGNYHPFYALNSDNFEYHKDWRYCMRNTTFNTPKPSFFPSEVYIVVFNSDESNEYNGFQISWK